MQDIASALVSLGVTGPAALFAAAAGFMLRHIITSSSRKADEEVTAKVTAATALSALTTAVLTLRDAVARIEARLDK
jgi:hypothetical protein